MVDLPGIPAILCHERAKSFFEGSITYLNRTFGTMNVVGSVLQPQSQGAVERPHLTYKTTCKAFMEEFEEEFENQWDTSAAIFQWPVRTSCKVYNGNYTPYEIITGMKPRSPLDFSLATPAVLAK